jgi:hypothetical protein
MSAYLVSDSTKTEIQRVIERGGNSANGANGKSTSSRQLIWIKITVDNHDGTFDGQATAYSAYDGAWALYDTVKVREANDMPLKVGKRYLGINHGMDIDDVQWFIVWNTVLGDCVPVVTNTNLSTCTVTTKYTRLPLDFFNTMPDCTPDPND